MKVPHNRLDRQFDLLKDEYLQAARQVLESGWYVLGPQVEAFEREFAEYNDAPFCVGLASGLDALILAFDLLGLKPNDEVIVPANTYIATIMGITRNGLKPVLVEPDQFYNLDPARLEQAITPKTRAICAVHLYGQIADMPAIMNIAEKHHLAVVEDAAQAHGASIHGKKAGTWGDIGCFSFYPTKNLGGFGDGGAVLVKDRKLADDFKMMRNYGSRVTYYFERVGYNSRLDEIQAALLRVKLKHLDRLNQQRQQIARRYLEEINNPKIILPQLRFGMEGHIFHLFVIQTEDRDALIRYCDQHGIGTKIHYPQPPHLSQAYQQWGLQRGSFPITESMADHVLSLPIYNGMSPEEGDLVIDALNAY